LSAKRSVTAIVGIATLQACASTNLGNSCSTPRMEQVNSSALGIVLGVSSHRTLEAPFIVFDTPSQAQSQATLQLELKPAQLALPASLDETPCSGLDWRTYTVGVGSEDWQHFWGRPQPMPIEVGIGLWEFVIPFRSSEFGLAIVNTDSSAVVMACGCYGT
jgi:hypothetical protein